MSAVCLVVDRLQAGALGAYGNTWIETPHLDRLAGRSFVLDQAVIDAARLDALYRAYWQGRGAFLTEPLAPPASLPRRLSARAVRTALVTDEPQVADHPLAADFDELIRVEHDPVRRAAETVERTQMFRLMAAAGQWLGDADEPFLLWIHSRGMAGPWDAPPEFRRQFADEDDPVPPNFVDVPNFDVAPDADPDDLLGIRFAYAGQVALLDVCLGGLLDLLEETSLDRRTSLSLLSSRGFALGEHGQLGGRDALLHEELVHTAWMMALPDGSGAMDRSPALVQPADLYATLLDAFDALDSEAPPGSHSVLPLVRREAARLRDRVCMRSDDDDRAIRTAAWHMLLSAKDVEPEVRLFAKPDDRWEQNQVAGRCASVVEQLLDALTQYEQAARSGNLDDLPPLARELVERLDA